MILKSITLINFRNIENAHIDFDEHETVLIGQNGQGKTNVLEAIFLISTGKSFRTSKDTDMIMFSKNFLTVSAIIKNGIRTEEVLISIFRNSPKIIKINGEKVNKLGDLFGLLVSVCFSPFDISLVSDGPSVRRKFMDFNLCQFSPGYYYNLKQYFHILKQRNALLKSCQKDRKLINTLDFWNSQLVHFGIKIIKDREMFINLLSVYAQDKHYDISNKKEQLKIIFKPNVYHDFHKKLELSQDKDIKEGSSNVGPHKDDFCFLVNEKDLKAFGSQGQRKSSVISLKFSVLDFFYDKKNIVPVFLLDDVLSELDSDRQLLLFNFKSKFQSIVTQTDSYKVSETAKCLSVFEGNFSKYKQV